jgi:hypothetical protein
VWGSIVFDPPFDKNARTISHGPAVKYMSRWPDEFWKAQGFAPSMLWDELGSVWETTDRQPKDPPRPPDFGLTVFSGGTFVLPKIDDYRAKLKVVYPNPGAAKDDTLVDWPKVPGIMAGYAVPTVGQVTTVQKLLSRPHAGRIFFAGEQVSAGFYGYMEGALQSGGRAARDVILRAAKVHPSVVPGQPPAPTPAPAPPVSPPPPPPPKAKPAILAKVQRLGGVDYVAVQLDLLLPGPPPTIGTIAEALHLRTDVVFHDLLGYRANAPVVIALFRDQIGEPVPDDLEDARRQLRVAGTEFTANALFPEGSDTPYEAWPVEPDGNKPVVLPLSEGFRQVLDEATHKRQRQTRLAAIQPELDALGAENRSIRDAAQALTDDIELARAVGQRNAQDVALLEALDGLLGAMLAAPKTSPPADDRHDVEELRRLLDALRAEAHRHMLLEPVDAFEAGVVARRAAHADELLRLLEADPFVGHVRTLAANRDIAPPDLYRDSLEAVGFAMQALLASPASEAAVERHVLPMIDVIAAQAVNLDGVAALNPDLDRAIRQVPPLKPAKSVLEILVVGTAGLVPQADTLAVGVLQWAAPHILSGVASDAAGATAMAGRLYRVMVNCASICAPVPGVPARPLSMAERVALLEAIDQGNLARLQEVHWSARLGSSASWAWVLAVCNLVCFIAAVKGDGDANTLRRWANILGTGAGTALAVAVAVQRWSTLVELGIVRGPGGRALGVIGGAAAVVSGVVTAVEAEESGDKVGMWVAIGGATGGALSVAGLLVGAGAATTATVFGAPVGVVLMVAGAVLGIGTGIVALVRALLTEGSQLVFAAVLAQFNRDAGPFRDAAAVRPSLQAAFTAVQEGHHPVDFWDVDPEKCPQLADLGFGPALIARIVDESEDEVNTRLRQGNRETGPVPVGAP